MGKKTLAAILIVVVAMTFVSMCLSQSQVATETTSTTPHTFSSSTSQVSSTSSPSPSTTTATKNLENSQTQTTTTPQIAENETTTSTPPASSSNVPENQSQTSNATSTPSESQQSNEGMINFVEYFPTNPGHYILYRMTDEKRGLNYTVEVVSQYASPGEFLLTFTGINGTGYFRDSAISGVIKNAIYIRAGCPSALPALYWYLIYLPLSTENGSSWSWQSAWYTATLLGNVTVNGVHCKECVRVNIDGTSVRWDYLRGRGVAYFSKGAGLVDFEFNASDGSHFEARALQVKNLKPRTISGVLTLDFVNPAVGYRVQVAYCQVGKAGSGIVDSQGRFKLQVFFEKAITLRYGPSQSGYFDINVKKSKETKVWKDNVVLSMDYFTKQSFEKLRSTESWKELVRTMHFNAWMDIAEKAGELPQYKYAIYESRTLAVDHPEIYLQADELFNELLTTHPGMWDYYMVRTDNFYEEERLYKEIQKKINEGYADKFSWARFSITQFKPIRYREIYYNTSAFLPFIDLRLYFLGSALKAAGWRATPLSMAEFLYFKYKSEGVNPYLVVTGNGSAFVAYESGGTVKLVRYDGKVVNDKPKNVVLVFNDRYVWYPLMGRNDTSKDPGLAEVVRMYATKDDLPNLTEEERSLIKVLKENTEFNNETDELWALYFAARLHVASWQYYPKIMKILYPHEYQLWSINSNNSIYWGYGPNIMHCKDTYIAVISNELSPGTAMIAGLMRKLENQSLDTMMSIVFGDRQWYVIKGVNLRIAGLYLWFNSEIFFMTIDDGLLSHGGICIMMSAMAAGILRLADVPGLEYYIAGMQHTDRPGGHANVPVFMGREYGTINNLKWNNQFNDFENTPHAVFEKIITKNGWAMLVDWPPYNDGMIRTTFTFDGLLKLLEHLESLAPGMRIAKFTGEGVSGWTGVPLQQFIEEKVRPGNVIRYPW